VPDGERFHETRIPVRFHEVDSYGVVWHGHYASWLEAGRNDLAAAFGAGIVDMQPHGYLLPVVSMEIRYKRPALLGDVVVVATRLRAPRGAWLTFDYRVARGSDGTLLATARTRQVVLNRDRDLLVTLPSVLRDAVARIRAFHRGA
jgi:acyl-CoA thioester hydrolase